MGRFLVLIFCLVSGMESAPAVYVDVQPSKVLGVDVTGPPLAEYDSAIDRFFGANRSALLSSWLPFGVVVTNRTADTIVGVALRWQLDAGPASYILLADAFDDPSGELAPGKTAVALPLMLLVDPAHLPPQLRATPPAGYQPGPGNLPNFLQASSVQATLDGVIFASGLFSGPDTGKEYESYLANRTIPRRIAEHVLAMKIGGDPVANILAWLQTQKQDVDRDTVGWWDADAANRIVRQLTRNYDRGGEAQFFKTAERAAEKPKIRLYR